MARPVNAEAAADVKRIYGDHALLRLIWTGDASTVFHVLVDGAVAGFLKVGANLAPERDRLEWLASTPLPVAHVVSYGSTASTDWLVLTSVEGLDLTNLKHTEPPHRIAGWLADAINVIHATPAGDCPFGTATANAVLTHGDACLPNVLFSNGQLSGIVDVGNAGLAHPAVDLALGVWSLQYNLGPGYGAGFLHAYGIDLDAHGLALVTKENGDEALERV